MKDPSMVAEKWQRNLSAAGPSIEAGVNAVTTAPGLAASRQRNLYVQRVAERADHWAQRVASVSLPEWQQATLQKGLARVASGAQQAQPKMEAFMREFLPHVERVATQVRAMPKGGVENGIARAVAQIRGNSQFRRSGG